ncbi:MAG TPA: hypothetical protein VNJ08_06190, partial [Bacteriovoracaceae bacterium]|nr:hypothetical protein [Bacteriovoracaceae bacterium]
MKAPIYFNLVAFLLFLTACNGGGIEVSNIKDPSAVISTKVIAPTSVTSTLDTTSKEVVVVWEDSNPAGTKYDVYACFAGSCTVVAGDVTNKTASISGLTELLDYNFKVIAKDAVGYVTEPTQTAAPTKTPLLAPNAFNVTGTLAGQVAVEWNVTSAILTDYIIGYCTTPGCDPTISPLQTVVSAGSNPEKLLTTSISPGDTVRVAVKTDYLNPLYSSAWSPVIQTTAVNTIPAKAEVPTVLESNSTSTSISWENDSLTESAVKVYRCDNLLASCTYPADYTLVSTLPANSTSTVLSGLTTNADYTVAIVNENVAGLSAPVFQGFQQTPSTPATPTAALSSAITSNTLTASWTDNSSIESGYIVTLCADAACSTVIETKNEAANTSSVSFANLLPLTDYFVKIEADGVIGDSNPLLMGPIMTITSAAAPTVCAIRETSTGHIKFSWTDNSTNETGFKIYGCDLSGSTCTNFLDHTLLATTAANVVTYTDSTVSSGVSYSYKVASDSTNGISTTLDCADAAAALSVPLAPSALTGTPNSTHYVDLAWTDNSAAESSFDIQYCVGSNCNFTSTTSVAAAAANDITKNVSVGYSTTYRFRIRATNATGSSAWVESSDVTTGGGLTVVTSVSASLNSTTKNIDLAWVDSNPSGTTYDVYACFSSTCRLVESDATVKNASISGLTELLDYDFKVVAKDDIANTTTGTQTTTTTKTPLLAPDNFIVTGTLAGQVAVEWDINSTVLTDYVIRYCVTPACDPKVSSLETIVTAGSDPRQLLTTGITSGDTVRLAVKADYLNPVYSSAWSSVIQTTAVNTVPATAANATLTESNSTSTRISWDNNSLTESAVKVYRCDNLQASCTYPADYTLVSTLPANTTTAVLGGLTNNSNYTVAVVNENVAGLAAPRFIGFQQTPSTPATPTAASSSAITANTFTASWTDNSSIESGYIIKLCAEAACTTVIETKNEAANTSSVSFANLQPLTDYYVKIEADGVVGDSAPLVLGPVSTITASAAPTVCAINETSTGHIKFSWTDNSTNETGFKVYACDLSGSACTAFLDHTLLATTAANVVTYSDTTVISGRSYSYKIASSSTNGISSTLDCADTAAAVSAPTAPSGLGGVASSSTINLSWTDNSSVETGFDIQYCVGAACTFSTVTSTTAAANATTKSISLSYSTTYRFRIRSTNGTGNSAWVETTDVATSEGMSLATSQVTASSPLLPHDGVNTSTITVALKDGGGANFVATETVEIRAFLQGTTTPVAVTYTGGNGACTTPATNCIRATYNSTANIYTVNVTSTSQSAKEFTAILIGSPDRTIVDTAVVNFNSSLFTTVSSNTTITNTNAGQNLLITAGTATFQCGTDVALGAVIIRGGTVTHDISSTTTVCKLKFSATTLTMTGGTINLNGKGYNGQYSYDPNHTNKTSNVLGYGLMADTNIGGSHAGHGGHNTSDLTKHLPIFDDYKNPQLAGGGTNYSSSSGISHGGGILIASVTGGCVINTGATISATGGTNYAGAAGGTINLTCATFSGTAATGAIIANGTGYYGSGGGGGGMIRLKATSNNRNAFTGSFDYPADTTKLSAFLNVVQARGGGGMATLGNGSAGTIFLEHTGSTYGDLIVSNKGVTSYSTAGVTHLRSLQGTLSAGI